MSLTRIRLRQTKKGDSLDDQKSAADIVNAGTISVTEDDFQNYVLSQLKRIIHGDHAGLWHDDFVAGGILDLQDLTAQADPRQLIYLADGVGGPMEGFPSGSVRETLPLGSPFPTVITWWTDVTKTKKLVQKDITFNPSKLPTLVRWSLYQPDGLTVIRTVTDTITYSAVFETSRTRVIT